MDELLPCPFCSGQDMRLSTRKTTILECQGCGAMFITRSEFAAVAKWNTRVIQGAGAVPMISAHEQKPAKPGDS